MGAIVVSKISKISTLVKLSTEDVIIDVGSGGRCFRAVVGLSNGIKNAQIGHKLTELWQFKVCSTLTNLSEGSLINAILIRQHELLNPRNNCFKLQSWSRTCVLTKLGYDEYPTTTSAFQNTCYNTSK